MKWKKFLPIIGISLFIYILIKLNILEVFNKIGGLDLTYFLLAVSFVIIILTTQTLKWFVIAKIQKISIPFRDAFRINLISNFYGIITPSKLGTVVRANYLKKYIGNMGKGISNFVLDKLLDVSSVLFIAIIFSMIFQKKFSIISIPLSIIIFILIVALMIFFIDKKRSKSLLRVVYIKLIPKKVKERARLTFHSFYEDMPKKRNFLFFFIMNLLNWLAIYILVFLIGNSLGVDIKLIHFLAILPIGTLVAFIPITLSGIGTRDLVWLTLFGKFGIDGATIISMSLLTLFLTGIVPAAIGGLVILFERVKSRKTRNRLVQLEENVNYVKYF